MNLDEAQRKKVSEWIGQGLKLSEIQTRLQTELGLQMKYLEVRMLVDDLKLVPKDIDPPSPPVLPLAAKPPAAESPAAPAEPQEPAPGAARVAVTVDQLARPGAVVSGKVTFSDGKRAEWYFDQSGRLALAAAERGYRPPAADLQEFQTALDAELGRMGF